MAARKLQGEIERTLKKVGEGIIEFEGILSKVQGAASTNQKDKYENDLKREIKKLQRMREQIKAWISGNEVKNKTPLVDARKAIETQMEKFKSYEREAKTKAYSKEGLQSQREKAKKDGRSEITGWLRKSIDALKVQIDTLELQLQGDAKKKKGTDAGRTVLERHNFHLDSLEKILRLWENQAVSKEEIDDIRESVDYYIENNQDPDFVEDETIYENINTDLSTVQLAASATGEDGSDGDIDGDDDDETSDLEFSDSDDEAHSDTSKDESPATRTVSAPPTPSKQRVNSAKVDTEPDDYLSKQPQAPPKAATRPKSTATAEKKEDQLVTSNNDEKKPVSVEPDKKDADKKFIEQPAKRSPAVAVTMDDDASSKNKTLDKINTTVDSSTPPVESEKPAATLPVDVAAAVQGSAPVSVGTSTSAPGNTPSGIPMMLASLQNSFNNLPESMESSRPQQYKPKTPFSTPQHYPTQPAAVFDNPAVFEKFDTDTLFFIFYYQQGTYQQYLAAKELKRQSWRYHKKYLTWFQRHEEPKEITADYEQGTYVYFDYETGWCQRKKTEFTFQYRYLEDKDLV